MCAYYIMLCFAIYLSYLISVIFIIRVRMRDNLGLSYKILSYCTHLTFISITLYFLNFSKDVSVSNRNTICKHLLKHKKNSTHTLHFPLNISVLFKMTANMLS